MAESHASHWTDRVHGVAAGDGSSPPLWLLALGAALSGCAGLLLTGWGPLATVIAISLAVALFLITRPFAIYCIVVALIGLEALNTLGTAELFTFTAVKIAGFTLLVALLPVIAFYEFRLRLNALTACAGVFLLALFASLLRADNTRAAIMASLTYIQLFILFLITPFFVRHRRRLRILARVAVLSLAVSAALGVWQYAVNPAARVMGTSQNASVLSADLLVALAFALALGATAMSAPRRAVWMAGVALLVCGVVVALSRAAYLAAIPALLVGGLYLRRPGRVALALVALVPLIVILAPFPLRRLAETSVERDLSTRGHLYSIQAGWRMMLDHPILGVGPGNFADHYLRYSNDEGGVPRTSHNSYLAIGSEMGLLALLAFVGLHLLAFRALWRFSRHFHLARDREGLWWCAALAVVLVNFMLIGLFHELHVAKYLWIALALGNLPPWRQELRLDI